GERIVWHGVPAPWVAARRMIFLLVFLTVWTGGVLFGLWNLALTQGTKPNAPLFSLIVLGVMVVFGGVSWLRALRSFAGCWQTAYALTDRRIIIAVGESGDTQSFTAAGLGDISRTGDEQRGSLTFGGNAPNPRFGRGTWLDAYSNGFYGISDPARV